MTTSFTPHPDAPTIVGPQLRLAPESPASAPAPTWRGGWLESGLAAFLAVAALGTVGGVAFATMTSVRPTSAPAATSAPGNPIPTAPMVTAAPTAEAPAERAPVRIAGPTRVVTTHSVVPAPVAAFPSSPPPPPVAEPVVTPLEPVTPAKPPLGVGTCDLVACDSSPQPPHNSPTHCGDLVACQTIPPRESS